MDPEELRKLVDAAVTERMDARLKEMGSILDTRLNKVVIDHIGRFTEKRLPGLIKSAVEAMPKPEAPVTTSTVGTEGEGPELVALRRELETERKASATAQAQAMAERTRTGLRAAMAGAGIREALREPLVALLERDGLVGYDTESKRVLVGERPASEHFTDWTATADGQHYLEPVEGGGTGRVVSKALPPSGNERAMAAKAKAWGY